jgi:hypothetical protein
MASVASIFLATLLVWISLVVVRPCVGCICIHFNSNVLEVNWNITEFNYTEMNIFVLPLCVGVKLELNNAPIQPNTCGLMPNRIQPGCMCMCIQFKSIYVGVKI